MELKILNKDAKDTGKIKLPVQFSEEVRSDLVKRAVLAIQANTRQRYGASPEAGKRAVSYVSKRRRAYKTTYGIGQSRTPRKVISRSGTRFNWVGAFAPQTVGGRRAHPPKASKIWSQKINIDENRKAIRSALSASVISSFVKERGHVVPDNYPFVLSDDFLSISKTSELKKALEALGFSDELKRASSRKIRAGKGKLRGRRYRSKKSILFVVSNKAELFKAVSNLPGCEVALVSDLNALLLAPGAVPGRLALFSESAIKLLEERGLFIKKPNGVSKKEDVVKEKPKASKKVSKKVSKKSSSTVKKSKTVKKKTVRDKK